MKKMEDLIQQVGRPYQMVNRDKTYQGCFYPMQFLYPDLPRFEMPHGNLREVGEFALAKIKEYFDEIPPAELNAGDIIVTEIKGAFHVAVYWEFGKIIHVFKDHTLQIGRLKIFRDFQSYRVK